MWDRSTVRAALRTASEGGPYTRKRSQEAGQGPPLQWQAWTLPFSSCGNSRANNLYAGTGTWLESVLSGRSAAQYANLYFRDGTSLVPGSASGRAACPRRRLEKLHSAEANP